MDVSDRDAILQKIAEAEKKPATGAGFLLGRPAAAAWLFGTRLLCTRDKKLFQPGVHPLPGATAGSVALGDTTKTSDIDLLARFDGSATLGPFFGLKLFLEETARQLARAGPRRPSRRMRTTDGTAAPESASNA